MVRTALLVSLAAALAACGGPSTQADAGTPLKCHERPFTATGAPTSIDAQLTSNVFAVPLTVGASQKTVVVDTGAPVTLLDPSVWTGETLPMGQGSLASLTLGGLTATDVKVVGAAVGATTGDGPLPGLVGGDFLCHFETSFDYRQPRVLLGDQAMPTDLAAPVTVAAPVKGGGLGGLPVGDKVVVVELPPTRIVSGRRRCSSTSRGSRTRCRRASTAGGWRRRRAARRCGPISRPSRPSSRRAASPRRGSR